MASGSGYGIGNQLAPNPAAAKSAGPASLVPSAPPAPQSAAESLFEILVHADSQNYSMSMYRLAWWAAFTNETPEKAYGQYLGFVTIEPDTILVPFLTKPEEAMHSKLVARFEAEVEQRATGRQDAADTFITGYAAKTYTPIMVEPKYRLPPVQKLKSPDLQLDAVAYRALPLIDPEEFLSFRLKVCHFLLRRQSSPIEHTKQFSGLLSLLNSQTAMRTRIEATIVQSSLLLDQGDRDIIQGQDAAYKEAYRKAVYTSVLWTLCGLDYSNPVTTRATFGNTPELFLKTDVLDNPWSIQSLEAEIACIEGDILFARERLRPLGAGVALADDESRFKNLMLSYIHKQLERPEQYTDYLLCKCFTDLLLEELGSEIPPEAQVEFRTFCHTATSLEDSTTTAAIRVMCATAVCHLTQFVPPVAEKTSLFKRHHNFSTELLNAGIAYIARYKDTKMTLLRGCALAMVQMMRFMAELETGAHLSQVFDEAISADPPNSPTPARVKMLWNQHEELVQPIRVACGSTYPQFTSSMFMAGNVEKLWTLAIDGEKMDVTALNQLLSIVPEWLWRWLSKDVLDVTGFPEQTTAYSNLLDVRTMLDIQTPYDNPYKDWLVEGELQVEESRGKSANEASGDGVIPILLRNRRAGWKGRNDARFDHSNGGIIRDWTVLTAYGLMDAALARITPAEDACVFSSLVTGFVYPARHFVNKATHYTLTGDDSNPQLQQFDKLLLPLPPDVAAVPKSFPGVIVKLRNAITTRFTQVDNLTTVRLQTLLNESALHGPKDLNQAVREAVVDRLVEQGGFGTPLRSWAKELHTAQNQEIKSHPLACEVGIRRMTAAFITKYGMFYAGEHKSVVDTVSSMASSVMSLTGGRNSPFERERSEVMKRLAAELDAVHAPAILANLRDAEAKAEETARLQVQEAIRLAKPEVEAFDVGDQHVFDPLAATYPPKRVVGSGSESSNETLFPAVQALQDGYGDPLPSWRSIGEYLPWPRGLPNDGQHHRKDAHRPLHYVAQGGGRRRQAPLSGRGHVLQRIRGRRGTQVRRPDQSARE